MAYTIAQVEASLMSTARLDPYFKLMGVDTALTEAPNNASPRPMFADAITSALFFCGIAPADPTAPSDADMLRLPAGKWLRLVDVAEYYFLNGYMGAVTTRTAGYKYAGGTEIKIVQAQAVVDYWKARLAYLRAQYGFGAGSMSVSALRVGMKRTRRTEF